MCKKPVTLTFVTCLQQIYYRYNTHKAHVVVTCQVLLEQKMEGQIQLPLHIILLRLYVMHDDRESIIFEMW